MLGNWPGRIEGVHLPRILDPPKDSTQRSTFAGGGRGGGGNSGGSAGLAEQGHHTGAAAFAGGDRDKKKSYHRYLGAYDCAESPKWYYRPDLRKRKRHILHREIWWAAAEGDVLDRRVSCESCVVGVTRERLQFVDG